MPTYARNPRVSHTGGTDTAVFIEGDVPYGRGERTVRIALPIRDLLEIARVYQIAKHPGHTVWHIQNPTHPLPCAGCMVPA